jgi:hypothetical protein
LLKGNFEPSFEWKEGGRNCLSLLCLCADVLKCLPRLVALYRQRHEILPRFRFNRSRLNEMPTIACLVIHEGFVIDKKWEVFTHGIHRVRPLSSCRASNDRDRILLANSVNISSCSGASTAWRLTLRTYISASATVLPFVTQ